VLMQHPYVVVAPAETVHVEAWPGSGRPVAVIPGLFGAAFAFRKVTPLLVAKGYRPIVIEPLGTGSSSRPEKADYSLTAQSHRIGAVLDSMHFSGVLVLAHSLGAAMAFRLAVDRPDLVDGIVSLEGGPTEEATTPVFRHAMRYVPWLKVFGGINLVRRKIHGMLLDSSGDKSWVTDGVVTAYTLGEARDYWLEHKDGLLSLYFTLPFASPVLSEAKGLTISVYDPTYFIAFDLAKPARKAAMLRQC